MANSKLHLRVPGKLMIAGEYAVLDPYQKAIVVAVNRYISTSIEKSYENHLSLPKQGLEDLTWKYKNNKIYFSKTDPRLHFVRNAIETVYQYLKEKKVPLHPFRLAISSELDDNSGRKFGLGSSAAVVVAVIASILNLKLDHEPSPDLIFKLSAIAHLKAQGSGSGADVAASAFGGWLLYSSFQPDWLLKKLEEEKKITSILEGDWPYLTIKKLKAPNNLHLCVGWTGKPARTAPLIKNIQALRAKKPLEYKRFLEESSIAVHKIVQCFEENDSIGALAGLEHNRYTLAKLGEKAKTPIETVELAKLAQIAQKHNGAGKPSGAGGGDCGIAFIVGRESIAKLKATWKMNKIIPLDIGVSKIGAIVLK